MQGPKPTAGQVADLTAYMRTLAPPPPAAPGDAAAARRGKEVFARGGCAGCHAPPTYTTPKTYDVGLRDEAGTSHFNPPSLRGAVGLPERPALGNLRAAERHQLPQGVPG